MQGRLPGHLGERRNDRLLVSMGNQEWQTRLCRGLGTTLVRLIGNIAIGKGQKEVVGNNVDGVIAILWESSCTYM
jgi:hypothetical protein